MSALENLSVKADEYDYADDNGPFPDIQDAMVSVGDLRAVRKLLPEIRALSHPVSPDTGVERPVEGGLPQDVINLVIAGRDALEYLYGTDDCDTCGLDKALEAFSERVPYENEPDTRPQAPGVAV